MPKKPHQTSNKALFTGATIVFVIFSAVVLWLFVAGNANRVEPAPQVITEVEKPVTPPVTPVDPPQEPPVEEEVVEQPTAQCNDGTYSYSQSRKGTCSHHGGVAEWY